MDAAGLEQQASSRRSSQAFELQEAAAAAAGALGANGSAQQGAAPAGKAAAAAAPDIEMGSGKGLLQRVGSSARDLLADRAATGLDRSATGLAAAAPGASRWGASYWTQVGRAVRCGCNACRRGVVNGCAEAFGMDQHGGD